jgi:LmbE family N-acetylglucosaminyl deacetylase
MNRVLVIVAHPDDEVLGAGGTIARHAANGDEVHVAFLTDGVSARGHEAEKAQRRDAAAREVASILGTLPPRFLAFPDNRLDGVQLLDIVQAIERIVTETSPLVVYTHHAGDLNIDHRICQRAVLTACRPLPNSTVRRIYAMEVASSTEWMPPQETTAFVPTRFVDISLTWEKKSRALKAYAEEMRPFPHPRSHQSIEALARWRGASAGLHAAEAFVTIRDIEA